MNIMRPKQKMFYFKAVTAILFIVSYTMCAKADTVTPNFAEATATADGNSIPMVNLIIDTESLSKETYTRGLIEIFDKQKRTDNNKELTTYNCKIKYRGASAIQHEKKAFAVKLLNDKGKSLDANILGIRKDDAWILDAMAIDRMRMRNRLLFDVWNDMSKTPYSTNNGNRNGTKGYFVEVYLNGEYHGLYCMTDKINRKLLGLKKADTDEQGNLEKVNGLLYKCTSWGDAAKFLGYNQEDLNGEKWNHWELQYPDDYPCEATYTPLKNFIDYCAYSTDEEFKNGIDTRFWLDNFMDYQIFVIANGLNDNSMKNTFLSTEDYSSNSKMMITPWDLDCSLGGMYDGSYYNDVSFANQNEAHLYVKPYMRLWTQNINGYKDAVADRWRKFVTDGILSEEKFNSRIDAYVEQFVNSGAWQREYAKWNGNPVELKENPWKEAEYLKNWYKKNIKHLEDNIFNGLGTSCIRSCKTENTENTGIRKNLLGQDINNSYKGIIIKNGKKIITK